MMEMKKGLLVDPIPNFLNLHHNYYVADSKENNWDLDSERVNCSFSRLYFQWSLWQQFFSSHNILTQIACSYNCEVAVWPLG